MATKYADGYDSNIANQAASDSGTGCVVIKPFEYQVGVSPNHLAAADVLHLVGIPLGAIVTEIFLQFVDDLDSGTTLQWDLGDSDSATTFLSNSTLGRAANDTIFIGPCFTVTNGSIAENASLPKRYNAADTIKITVDAISDQAGTIRGYVKYTLQSSNSLKTSNVYGGKR